MAPAAMSDCILDVEFKLRLQVEWLDVVNLQPNSLFPAGPALAAVQLDALLADLAPA